MAKNFICNPDYPVVDTKAGKLRGFVLDGIFTFQGIKYANAARWQMPTEVESWEGIRDATNYGYTAPTSSQPMPTGEIFIPHRFWPENEHCQYLNIWTKSIEREAKRPVVVWFHGGGFQDGSSIEQVAYEGDALAEYGDLVVITVNHRLNILGFLDMSGFGEKYWNSINAGLADLVAALRWVHENIAGFGGDPDNVTIFGQSGGGGKVAALLQIPSAAGLFHKAMMMSGGAVPRDYIPEHREIIGQIMAELEIPAGRPEMLEKVPYEILIRAYNRVCRQNGSAIQWRPQINEFYSGHPVEAGFSEYAKKVPIVVGSVLAEFGAYGGLKLDHEHSEDEVIAKLRESYGENTGRLIRLFRETYPDKELKRLAQLDFHLRRGCLRFMDARAEAKPEAPGYNYLFSLIFDINGGTPAWHCSDIPFVFHNCSRVGNCNIQGVTERLEEEMAGALVNFAYSGDPNHGKMAEWKPYTKENRVTMYFDRESVCKKLSDQELADELAKCSPPPMPLADALFNTEGEIEGGRAWLY